MGITRCLRFHRTWRGAVLALAAVCGAPARADGQIYLCIDAHGRKELTDTNKLGCKQLDLPGTIAAPPPRKWDGTLRPNVPLAPSSAPSASNFPKVDGAQQRARDNDRRQILNDELHSEEQKLAEQKQAFNNGEPERQGGEKNYAKYQERVAQMRDDLSRTEKNIEALKRELSTIK